MTERLYRSEDDRILGGVCGGFAEAYDIDPSLVRIIMLLIVLGTGFGLLVYLAAWLIIPTESEIKDAGETGDEEEEDE